jgi:hypothetical protein
MTSGTIIQMKSRMTAGDIISRALARVCNVAMALPLRK